MYLLGEEIIRGRSCFLLRGMNTQRVIFVLRAKNRGRLFLSPEERIQGWLFLSEQNIGVEGGLFLL